MKKKIIDIENYDSFIENGFQKCNKCNWAFAPGFFDDHNCSTELLHNHLDPKVKYKDNCPACNKN